MLLPGFKTDFNYKIKEETSLSNPNKSIKSINVDYYHFTSGLKLRIRRQHITAGLKYSLKLSNNTNQLFIFRIRSGLTSMNTKHFREPAQIR